MGFPKHQQYSPLSKPMHFNSNKHPSWESHQAAVSPLTIKPLGAEHSQQEDSFNEHAACLKLKSLKYWFLTKMSLRWAIFIGIWMMHMHIILRFCPSVNPPSFRASTLLSGPPRGHHWAAVEQRSIFHDFDEENPWRFTETSSIFRKSKD